MGTTRNSYLWYHAICGTRCTYSMHGIGRFNGILYPGRRRNYQTFSIPSRLAPMSFLFERKNKTVPSPHEIGILSNNSMALRIRYEKILLLFFQNIRLCIERVVWEKRYFRFFLSIGSPFQRHKLFLFSHRKALNNIYVIKSTKIKKKKKIKIIFFPYFRIKKKLWDCWITDEINI